MGGPWWDRVFFPTSVALEESLEFIGVIIVVAGVVACTAKGSSTSAGRKASPGAGKCGSGSGRRRNPDSAVGEWASEQDGREGPDATEAAAGVGRTRGDVVVVDIQRHLVGQSAENVLQNGRHRRHSETLTAQPWVDPDALNLRATEGEEPTSALKMTSPSSTRMKVCLAG